MQLVLKQSFHDFFYMRQRNSADMDLLYRMQALNRDTVCNQLTFTGYYHVVFVNREIYLKKNGKLLVCGLCN